VTDDYRDICHLAAAMEPDARAVLAAEARRGIAPQPSTAVLIGEVCDEVKAMLIAKNAAYGDSATDPVRIFSKADPVEQILVRIDDKLSRLARGQAAGEDVVKDLLGYLVLLRVMQRKAGG
jgi:hypothetical protein